MNTESRALFDAELSDYRDMFNYKAVELNNHTTEELENLIRNADAIVHYFQTLSAAARTVRRVRKDINLLPDEMLARERAQRKLDSNYTTNLRVPKEDIYEKMVREFIKNGMDEDEAEAFARKALEGA